jgi:hypothetical protein
MAKKFMKLPTPLLGTVKLVDQVPLPVEWYTCVKSMA